MLKMMLSMCTYLAPVDDLRDMKLDKPAISPPMPPLLPLPVLSPPGRLPIVARPFSPPSIIAGVVASVVVR